MCPESRLRELGTGTFTTLPPSDFFQRRTRAHSSCTTTPWDTDILINAFYFLFCLFGATTSISSVTTFRHISRKGFFCTTMSIGHGRHMISGRRYPPTQGRRVMRTTGFFFLSAVWAGGFGHAPGVQQDGTDFGQSKLGSHYGLAAPEYLVHRLNYQHDNTSPTQDDATVFP